MAQTFWNQYGNIYKTLESTAIPLLGIGLIYRSMQKYMRIFSMLLFVTSFFKKGKCLKCSSDWVNTLKYTKDRQPFKILWEIYLCYYEKISKITYRKKNKLMNLENRLVVAKKEGEGVGWTRSFGLVDNKLLDLEWISNEILLYSPRKTIWSLVMEHDGGKCEKKRMYVYI